MPSQVPRLRIAPDRSTGDPTLAASVRGVPVSPNSPLSLSATSASPQSQRGMVVPSGIPRAPVRRALTIGGAGTATESALSLEASALPHQQAPDDDFQRPLVCAVEHGRDVLGDAALCTSREFIVTNGCGGYGSATLACTLSRSYHGLLIAALRVPLDRTLVFSALDDAAHYLGRSYLLTPHKFGAITGSAHHAGARSPRQRGPHRRDHDFSEHQSNETSDPSTRPVDKTPTESPRSARANGVATQKMIGGPGTWLTSANDATREPPSPLALRALLAGMNEEDADVAASLESFRLEGTTPVFTFAIADALLEKRIWMKRDENAVFIRYKLIRASRPLSLSLDALVNHRNHHHRTFASRPGFSYSISALDRKTVVVDFQPHIDGSNSSTSAPDEPTRLVLRCSRGQANIANAWVQGESLTAETERGLPPRDDHLLASSFSLDLLPGGSVTIVGAVVKVSGDPSNALPPFVKDLNGEAELEDSRKWECGLIDRYHNARELLLRRRLQIEQDGRRRLSTKSQHLRLRKTDADRARARPVEIIRSSVEPAISQLVLAADQFIISRDDGGKSIIAGYHWFADWSRDTMVSLPGLTIATGRLDIARAILLTFAGFVSEGMPCQLRIVVFTNNILGYCQLPNRFPDDGSKPSDDYYNTADGTLWYFESIRAYYAASQDRELIEDLFPVLESIVKHHCAGTRFGIKMDPVDGLLFAGEPGVALTWMDAKAGDRVFTPRIGKPVELGALWFNALSIVANFANELGHEEKSTMYNRMAYTTEKGFRHRFWNEHAGYCFDVVDGPGGEIDARLRPNQLIAASLQWSPLSAEQRLKVVEACAQHLLTSHALRTLSPSDVDYRGNYTGNVLERDSAYHQGTGWTWLIGPFVIAHMRAYGDPRAAREYLYPVLTTLGSAGQGTLSEIFEGDAPFRPRGCIAQAWSVAEILRAWLETEPLPPLALH